MTPPEYLPDSAKHSMDVLSVGAMVGAVFQWLPQVAALLTVIWTALRIYESILNIREKRRDAAGALLPRGEAADRE